MEKVLLAGMVHTFQPQNVTGWASEGVKEQYLFFRQKHSYMVFQTNQSSVLDSPQQLSMYILPCHKPKKERVVRILMKEKSLTVCF